MDSSPDSDSGETLVWGDNNTASGSAHGPGDGVDHYALTLPEQSAHDDHRFRWFREDRGIAPSHQVT